MLEPAPVSLHLDLYRYWLDKRGNRTMPARGDINPAEIPRVLPYIAIVQKVEGEFCFRLAGSAIARQFGQELTGDVVGSHVSNREETIAALGAVCERVSAKAHPVFSTGQHETERGVLHNVSFLLLPLSDDRRQVNRIIFTRIACFAGNAHPSREWLAGAIFKLRETVDVISEIDLASRCLEWERTCLAASEPLQRPA
jgi:hypothetical protein